MEHFKFLPKVLFIIELRNGFVIKLVQILIAIIYFDDIFTKYPCILINFINRYINDYVSFHQLSIPTKICNHILKFIVQYIPTIHHQINFDIS